MLFDSRCLDFLDLYTFAYHAVAVFYPPKQVIICFDIFFSLLVSFVCVCVIQMSMFIVQCLNPFRKPDCKLGRIVNTEDFKHLARKVRWNDEDVDTSG